jgi:hypothetical protein
MLGMRSWDMVCSGQSTGEACWRSLSTPDRHLVSPYARATSRVSLNGQNEQLRALLEQVVDMA